MNYYEKLVKLLGRKPTEGSLEYNQKILGLKDAEASARSLFNTLISSPKERDRAKKLGLI